MRSRLLASPVSCFYAQANPEVKFSSGLLGYTGVDCMPDWVLVLVNLLSP